tara:strand:+ start:254 stop:526 length:273 start_codon:yes stop_codon:yes gene_type:complete
MSEKELDSLAIRIADKVFAKLIKKQQEWDQQFYAEVETIHKDNEMIDDQEWLDMKIASLKLKLNKAIADEDYTLASKINSKIIDLKAKQK